ncbi:hypothetical protein WJX82_002751 [Trebouxia sp. C0006]
MCSSSTGLQGQVSFGEEHILKNQNSFFKVRLTRQMEDVSTCYPLVYSLSRVTQTFLGGCVRLKNVELSQPLF